jgi:hypothetical protein
MKYIRDTYGVPAKRGGELIYTNCDGEKLKGKILSASNCHLKVRVEGYKRDLLLHPTCNVEYL